MFVIVIAVLVVAASVFATVLFAPRSLSVTNPDGDNLTLVTIADIENVTTVNPRFIDLAFLGSHDAFSASIDRNNKMDDSSPPRRGLNKRKTLFLRYGQRGVERMARPLER